RPAAPLRTTLRDTALREGVRELVYLAFIPSPPAPDPHSLIPSLPSPNVSPRPRHRRSSCHLHPGGVLGNGAKFGTAPAAEKAIDTHPENDPAQRAWNRETALRDARHRNRIRLVARS